MACARIAGCLQERSLHWEGTEVQLVVHVGLASIEADHATDHELVAAALEDMESTSAAE